MKCSLNNVFSQSLVSIIDFDSRDEAEILLKYNEQDPTFAYGVVYKFDGGNKEIFAQFIREKVDFESVYREFGNNDIIDDFDDKMHAKKEIVNIHGEKIGEIVIGYNLDEVIEQTKSSKLKSYE